MINYLKGIKTVGKKMRKWGERGSTSIPLTCMYMIFTQSNHKVYHIRKFVIPVIHKINDIIIGKRINVVKGQGISREYQTKMF